MAPAAVPDARDTPDRSALAEAAAPKVEGQLDNTEERFRLLVESVVDYAIFMLDAEGYVSTWNAGAERIKGYAASDIIGHHFSEFYPEDAVRAGWPAHELREARAVGRFEDEGWRVRKDGSRFWASVVITALRDTQGQVCGFAKVTRDLTERRMAEERLRTAHEALELRVRERTAQLSAVNEQLRAEIARREQLEVELRQSVEHLRDTDRHRNAFLAILAHELRNPLAPIRNAIEYLQVRGPGEPGLERARAIIDRQARQMARLVDDLMDLSRVTRNTLQVRKEPVALQGVLDDALTTSRPLLDDMQHQLEVDAPADPIVLEVDPTRLAQVFANLLNNAAKYTPPGGRISVVVSPDREGVAVTVRDTGIGIPAHLLPRVFEMFTQLQAGAERTAGGLGIGLTLARHIVEQHGGTLDAHSPGPGLGSTFTVRLPVGAPRPTPASGNTETDGLAHDLRGCRVLVVDDNRDAADSLAMVLAGAGATVRVAYDGVEGLAVADAFRPQLLLLDLGLPGRDGLEMARELRGRDWGREAVLVATTGWGQEADRLRALRAGFDHHYTKPVDPAVFGRIMCRHRPAESAPIATPPPES